MLFFFQTNREQRIMLLNLILRCASNIVRFAFGLLPNRISGYAYLLVAQTLAMSTYYIFCAIVCFEDDDRIKRLILTYLEKTLCQKFSKVTNFEQNLRLKCWKRKRFRNCRFHILGVRYGSLIFGFGVLLICNLCICID